MPAGVPADACSRPTDGGALAVPPSTSIAPTGRSSRSTRPEHRPRPGVHDSASGPATCCCTTRSPTSAGSSPRRRGGHRGVARGTTIYLPDGARALPAGARRGCRQPAARRSAPGDRVPRARRRRRRRHARRRRAGDHPQPGQARLRPVRRRTSAEGSTSSSRRVAPAEDRTWRAGVESPEQDRAHDTHGYAARSGRGSPARRRTRHVAGHQHGRRPTRCCAAHTGLFRVMAEPDRGAVAGCATPRTRSGWTGRPTRRSTAFPRSLPPTTRAPRRSCSPCAAPAGRRRTCPTPPGSDAVARRDGRHLRRTPPRRCAASPIATSCRPALAVANGDAGARRTSQQAFAELPDAMAKAEPAGQPDRPGRHRSRRGGDAAGPRGQTFDGVVVDDDERASRVQLAEPAVLARLGPTGSTRRRRAGRARPRRPGRRASSPPASPSRSPSECCTGIRAARPPRGAFRRLANSAPIRTSGRRERVRPEPSST